MTIVLLKAMGQPFSVVLWQEMAIGRPHADDIVNVSVTVAVVGE